MHLLHAILELHKHTGLSWCENQGTGGSYLLGSFDIGAVCVQLQRASLEANGKLVNTNTLGFTQVRAASSVTPYSCFSLYLI